MFGSDRYSKIDAIFDRHNRQGKTQDRSSSVDAGRSRIDDLEQSFDTLSDGLDGKLKEAANYFEFDPEEIDKEDYSFRYDTTFHPGSTYNAKVWFNGNPKLTWLSLFFIFSFTCSVYI